MKERWMEAGITSEQLLNNLSPWWQDQSITADRRRRLCCCNDGGASLSPERTWRQTWWHVFEFNYHTNKQPEKRREELLLASKWNGVSHRQAVWEVAPPAGCAHHKGPKSQTTQSLSVCRGRSYRKNIPTFRVPLDRWAAEDLEPAVHTKQEVVSPDQELLTGLSWFSDPGKQPADPVVWFPVFAPVRVSDVLSSCRLTEEEHISSSSPVPSAGSLLQHLAPAAGFQSFWLLSSSLAQLGFDPKLKLSSLVL